jgi:hypothetical protein
MVRELSGRAHENGIDRGAHSSTASSFLDDRSRTGCGQSKTGAQFLRIYNEHHIVTLLTSHYAGDIEELCHQILVIDAAKSFSTVRWKVVDRFSDTKF